MKDYVTMIDELIRQSEEGTLRTHVFDLQSFLSPPRKTNTDRNGRFTSNPNLRGHERMRSIVAELTDKGLSTSEICTVTGYTEIAVRHHLWVLEQKRLYLQRIGAKIG